jgi:putative oxygen-independent coproporphyrinogen III oxidase
LSERPPAGFGVYVHWPYCARICPYCDFNVYAAKARAEAPLVDAIIADLAGWRAMTGPRRVDSVFFGGGTPSLMSENAVGEVLAQIEALWGLQSDAEITLEANPDDAARFAGFSAAGVNRLSIGVQALRPDRLAFLGRTHSVEAGLAAVDAARRLFRSISIDLIYATPGQAVSAWERELKSALGLGVDHLSLYELSIEPGAAFAFAVRRGHWSPLEDDRAADLYEATQAICQSAGYPAYEVSNHARSGEHASRHNLIYWRSGDWVGVGPGAHGRLTLDGRRYAVEALARPGSYLRAVRESGRGFTALDVLSDLDAAREEIAMGLRLAEGMALRRLVQLGANLGAARVEEFETLGLLKRVDERLRLTGAGMLAADRIVAELAP